MPVGDLGPGLMIVTRFTALLVLLPFLLFKMGASAVGASFSSDCQEGSLLSCELLRTEAVAAANTDGDADRDSLKLSARPTPPTYVANT